MDFNRASAGKCFGRLYPSSEKTNVTETVQLAKKKKKKA